MKNINKKFRKHFIVMVIIGLLAFCAGEFVVELILSESINRTWTSFSIGLIIVPAVAANIYIAFQMKKGQIALLKTKELYNTKDKEIKDKEVSLLELSTILSGLNQSVCVVTKDESIKWVNDSFERLFGYTKNETLGKSLAELLAGPKTDIAQIKRLDEAIFVKKVPITIKVLHYRKDKSTFWARVDITPLLDEKGELEKYIAVSSDITQEHELELQVSKSESDFHDITRSVEDVLYLFNITDSKYEFISETCSKTLGAPPLFFYSGESHTRQFGHPEDIGKMLEAADMVVAGTPYEIEYRLIINEEIRWIREKSFPIKNEKGEVTRNSGICQDITENKKIKQKLLNAETNFNQIAETVADTFYLYNIEEKKYEFISSNCKEVLGVSDQTFYSGESWKHLEWHSDDVALINDSFDRVNSGLSYDIEYRMIEGNTVRWIRERSFPIKDANGMVRRNSGICSDITEFKTKSLELERARANTKIVAKIGALINEELGLVNVIKTVYSSINELMDAQGFGIGVINSKKGVMKFPYFIEGEHVYENIDYPLEDNLLCNISSKQDLEILIHDIEKDLSNYTDAPLQYTQGKSSESVIYLPLKIEGNVIGVLTVQSFEKNAYTEDQLNLLRSISVYAANAVEKAGVFDSLEENVKNRTIELAEINKDLLRRNNEIQMTSQLGIQMTQSLNLDIVFESIYSQVCELFGSDMFGIRIYRPEFEEVEYAYGMENNVRDKVFSVPMTDKNNYTVWCIDNKKEIFINDNEVEYKDYVPESKPTTGELPNSIIMCLITVNDSIIGVMSVQSLKKNAFENRHLHLLRALSAYASSAMSNMAIFDSLEAKIDERTKELSLKNKEITSSITYAQRIQFSTLPTKETREHIFKRSFVLYKPKDIVSGDFFRFDEIKTNDDTQLHSFLVGDCTGHGVPGATLAILCSSLMKQSASEETVTNPGESLDFVRDNLNKLFFSSDEDGNLYDGMDAGLAVIDKVTNILYYSGAHRDCDIVRNGEIITVKGDRQHVGYSDQTVPFETKEFQLQKGDVLFVTSDGYIDQFGGPNHRKLMKHRYHKTIIEAASMPAIKREKHLASVLDSWQGDLDQIDDVCLIGVEVDW